MAEVKGKIGVTTENIFPVIKQFLYSDHEIFLRELVANAVDATEKIKALASSGDFKGVLGDLFVKIELDEDKNNIRTRAIPTDSRRYCYIVSSMKALRDSCSEGQAAVNKLIEEFRTQYSRRRSMMRELNKLR